MPGLLVALQAINALLALVPEGTALWQQWTTAKTQIQAMVDAGRDPTPEEWAALDATVKTDEAALDAAAQS